MRQPTIPFHLLVLVAFLAGAVFAPQSARAAAPTFVLRNPTPQCTSLVDVTFASNRFVIVGDAGLVLTSTDGATWHIAANLTGGGLNAVAFGAGQWIAVGVAGRIFTSPDAFTWTLRSSPTTQPLNAVTYASNQWLACGNTGTIITSPDGISWTPRSSGTALPLTGIAGRTGAHVAVGDDNTLLRSTDGATWTPHTLAEPTTDLRSAAILNNQFVVAGYAGRIYTSPDGVTWTSRANSGTGGAGYESVTYDGTQYIITTFGGSLVPTANFTNRPLIATSFNPSVPRNGIAFGAGVIVAVGEGGDIATSSDGRTWVQRGSSGAEYRINNVASLNGRWFAGATYGTIYSSADGVTWSRPATLAGELFGWAYGANRYVGVGAGGRVATSSDGIAWSTDTTSSGVTRSLTGATFGNGRFVAVGDGGVVTTSTDGLAWTPRTSGVTTNLNAIVTLGSRYVAVGDAGVIITSNDGATWTRATNTGTANLVGACVHGGIAYTTGTGTILSSPDGQTWTRRVTNSAAYAGIAPAHGGLVAAVFGGSVSYSPDGITWSTLTGLPTAGGAFQGAGSDGTTAMIVGNGGTILQSIDPNAPPSRLVNVATRGLVQAGGSLTPGFVLKGTGSKQVVVRAVGPTLSVFGLPALADLKLELVNQQTNATVATNDDWGGSAALSTRFASLGAFPLAPASRDAAVQATLPINNGGYSVRITASGTGTSGVALAEVYDADDASSSVRLANVSTLGFVGTDENVLTPGFVISGTRPKRLLIRAIGPGLIPLGVEAVLADPQFSVFPAGASVAIAGSNDWGGTVALRTTFTNAGAFAVADNSRDAAVDVTLAPGGYTVVTSGTGNTTGTALVEIYDLDP
jgi:hypothetical protein